MRTLNSHRLHAQISRISRSHPPKPPPHPNPNKPPMAAYASSSLFSIYSLLTPTSRFESAANGSLRLSFFSPRHSVRSPPNHHTGFSIIRKKATRLVRVTAVDLASHLISPNDHWGTWAALFATAAFGTWSENTKIGSTVSGAVVSILLGLALSNIGVIASEAQAYKIVMEYLLPLAIPMLLFSADIKRVFKSTGKLLLAFLLGSVATIVGTVVAYKLVPMKSLGQDSWKIAAALMGSYIGGAVNYVAVSNALGLSPSVFAAGMAVDNVMCAIYFMLLFALASKISAEPADDNVDKKHKEEKKQHGLQSAAAAAAAVSFTICKASSSISKHFDFLGGTLPCATAITVILATMFPTHCGYLAPAGEAISLILMQVFFVVIGASGSIQNVINTAPSIFTFAFVQLSVHLATLLGVGKLLKLDQKSLLIASNANIRGPTTACGMATTKGWHSLKIPALLAGIFGISIATFLGIGTGLFVLRHL